MTSGMTEQQIETFETEFIKENRLGTALNWYRGFFWDKPQNPFKAIALSASEGMEVLRQELSAQPEKI